MKKHMRLLAQLPSSYYLKVSVESEEDECGTKNLNQYVISLMESPPEDGWPNAAAYFGLPEDSPRALEDAGPYKHDDSCLCSVNSASRKTVSELALQMLTDHIWKLSMKESDDRQTKIFVDPSVKESGDGSAASPFKTISEAASVAKPCQTIMVVTGGKE